IIGMFNPAFDGICASEGDYAPDELPRQIDALSAEVYDAVDNGVAKVGFATEQGVYDQGGHKLRASLDKREATPGTQRYLLGDVVTEADWRLSTTLIRFDPVYHGHFKCNLQRLADYKNLWRYTRELYQWPGVASTVDFEQIKQHYYRS